MSSGAIRRLRERLVHRTPWASVYDDDVEFPSGRQGRHLRIEPPDPGALGVVVVVEERAPTGTRLALVRTHRYPMGQDQWGFPRGHAHGVDPLLTAVAEVREELGVGVRDAEVLGTFTPDSGLLAHRVAVVGALSTGRGTGPTDTDEVAEVAWVPADQVAARIRQGTLDDGMTIVAFHLWSTRTGHG